MNDILNLLGIDPKSVKVKKTQRLDEEKRRRESSAAVKTMTEMSDEEQKTEFVLNVTDWDREKGKQIPSNLSPSANADFFNLCFSLNPEVVGNCEDQSRQQFIESIIDSPEYRSLHKQTMGKTLPSLSAAKTFIEAFAKTEEEKKKDKSGTKTKTPSTEQSDDQNDEDGEGEDGGLQLPTIGQGQGQGEGQDVPDGIKELINISEALEEAQKDVDRLEDVARATGIGSEGPTNDRTNMLSLTKAFEMVQRSPTLRRIMDRAGAFRRYAQSIQKKKLVHGSDILVGVDMAGLEEIERVLPEELAFLCDEDLEDIAIGKLIEGSALAYDMKEEEKLGRGPIVLCVDESTSMKAEMRNGSRRIEEAKAFALAMVWIAQYQRRWVCLLSFAAMSEGSLLVIKPGERKEIEILQWCERMMGGGTSSYCPCKTLPFKYWDEIGADRQKGKVDMIILTDGQVHINDEIRDDFLKWKEEKKVKCQGIVIGSSSTGMIEAVCDDVQMDHEITMDVVKNALSI